MPHLVWKRTSSVMIHPVWKKTGSVDVHPTWKMAGSVELLMMYRFKRCHKLVARVPSCTSSDEIRWWCPLIMIMIKIIYSLLRGIFEYCNFKRYYYCTFIVLLLYLLWEIQKPSSTCKSGGYKILLWWLQKNSLVDEKYFLRGYKILPNGF